MEVNKSESQIYFEKYSKNINQYNEFMIKLFLDISKPNFDVFKDTKLTKDKLIQNMQSNIKDLFIFINELNEVVNKDIYKCLSCIFGAFLGDAIGGYCEFKKPNSQNMNKIFVGNPLFGESPGQVTDDSEMAMSSAYAIMENPEFDNLNSDFLFYFYGLWHLSKPKDEGITTRKALKLFKPLDFNPGKKNNFETVFKDIKQKNDKSLANGFLMRTSPFIVWCYFRYKNIIIETFKSNNSGELFKLFLKIKEQANKDNICTHPNDSLSIAHSIFSIMSLGAICELKPHQILNNVELLLSDQFFNNKECIDIKNMILEELKVYKNDKSLINNYFSYFTKGKNNVNTHMGYYYHAFKLTLYYLFYFNEINGDNNYTKYRTIMNQICNIGGDTDTNAAIVGTVIGPLLGYKNFGNSEFQKMVTLIPKKRFIYSPALMIIYVYFLKDNINYSGTMNMNFLKMIIYILFEKIDVNNLNNIFLNFN